MHGETFVLHLQCAAAWQQQHFLPFQLALLLLLLLLRLLLLLLLLLLLFPRWCGVWQQHVDAAAARQGVCVRHRNSLPFSKLKACCSRCSSCCFSCCCCGVSHMSPRASVCSPTLASNQQLLKSNTRVCCSDCASRTTNSRCRRRAAHNNSSSSSSNSSSSNTSSSNNTQYVRAMPQTLSSTTANTQK